MKLYDKDQYLQLSGDLFKQVQLTRVFSDGITFVDAEARSSKDVILAEYEKQKNDPDFNLKEFVLEHFAIPVPIELAEPIHQHKVTMEEYINSIWTFLYREATKEKKDGGTLINLPYPFIIPGGRFRSIYYWDSFFTMLGLVKAERLFMTEHMIRNFAYLIGELGYIPNGNRIYLSTRSQPPFFALMLDLFQKVRGLKAIQEFLPLLEKEYEFWMQGKEKITESYSGQSHVVQLEKGEYLNRYCDADSLPREESYYEDLELANGMSDREKEQLWRDLRAAAESGWDFSSRWFKDYKSIKTIRTTDIIPVDLNCLIFYMEQRLGEWYAEFGNVEKSKKYTELAETRKALIQKYCWSEEKGYYFDYCISEKKMTDCWSLAGVYPLFFKIATKDQASSVSHIIEHKFLAPGGVITTINTTAEQWDAPNGWAPLQWLTIRGLQNYGYNQLADMIKISWIKTCEIAYDNTGCMLEKYNVVNPTVIAGGGEYTVQTGFGWTNGVLLDLIEK